MSVEAYHQKFVKLLKYVPDDKNHSKFHQFLMGLDSKIKTMVNFINPKTLEQAYDLAKRAKSNLVIIKTLMNYVSDKKYKEHFQRSRGTKQQASHNDSRKVNTVTRYLRERVDKAKCITLGSSCIIFQKEGWNTNIMY